MSARWSPDRARVTNAFGNPEATSDLTGYSVSGGLLERVVDSDLGKSAAHLYDANGTALIAFDPRFTMVQNQIIFVRVRVKKQGPGTVSLGANFHGSAGGLLAGQTFTLASAPFLENGEVVTLEGFHCATASATASVAVYVQITDAVDSEVWVTDVQVVPNARDDVPAYAATVDDVEIQPTVARGFSDQNLAQRWMDPDEHYQLLREFGCRWIRGGPEAADYDAPVTNWQAAPVAPWMNMLRRHNIRLLFTVGVPDFLTTAANDVSPYSLASADFDEWAAWAASFVAEWPDVVGAVEWFNEPNHGFFWGYGSGASRAPDPAKYTDALKVLYPAIKAVAPGIPVLAGCMTPANATNLASDPPMYGALDFLTAMYANGAKGYMDAVSLHPYPLAASTADVGTTTKLGYDEFMNGVRQIMRDNTNVLPLWISELGLNTTDAGTEKAQAIALKLLRGRAEREPDVDGVFIHQGWKDTPDTEGGYTLLTLSTGRRLQAASRFVARDARAA